MVKGGTTRIIYDLLWHLHSLFDITLLMLEGTDFCYSYPKSINILSSGGEGASNNVSRTISMLLNLNETSNKVDKIKPNTIISFLPRANIVNVLTLSLIHI